MSKRNTQQRRHWIVQQVNQLGEVAVEALAKALNTSEVTIRKDLTVLENSGLLLRRYGGAVALPQEFLESPEQKVSVRKLSIVARAAQLIADHNRIVIDSGSTTAALIEQLNHHRGLVIMTNALNIATKINELDGDPTLLMTGGTWDSNSEAFQGQVAERVLRSYDFDQLFIGADGIDVARGTTTFNELTGLSQVMAEVAREVIVLVESDKFGRKIPNCELSWAQITHVVTDDGVSPEMVAALEAQQVKVVIASTQ
ncbi:Glucitol operon repressor [Vibrio stylophorae]|uniref:Glucitol operon repressor n=1 Tax=Vibrio stylophorae TaxID=659351 RepID=A0ABM8ZQ43_9VIBR|nr:DeoR family transcriptional regulator [Vibrio stylophorae]CAH0532204.1 Glucitol operon repressor [Vibrio stylophorae]